jgi:5'-deoxynucleotidase YfbR-like HD superfamily hydrolase
LDLERKGNQTLTKELSQQERRDNLHRKWRASFVRRWHSNADLSHTVDPIVGHSGRVAIIINHLWPNCRKDLIVAAIHHDLSEYVTGDVRGDTKRENPKLDAELSRVERKAADDMGLSFDISEGEEVMLKFADKLDAYWWAIHHKPELAETADWKAAKGWLLQQSEKLGIAWGEWE